MKPPLRVVVTDPLIADFSSELRSTTRDHEWTFELDGDVERQRAVIAKADVLVASRLSAAATRDAASLRLVHVTGAGVDRIDEGAVAEGIALCNTGHHGQAIAEHVVLSALALRRRLISTDAQMRSGQWRTVGTAPGTPLHRTLHGDTIGLLGVGEIGSAVAGLAAAFGMRTIALRRRASLDAGPTIDRVYGRDELTEFLNQSDVIVVTVPLDDSTLGLLNDAAFAAMKPHAIVINVARGPIIDLDALERALRADRIGGAAIDVWWGAPSGTTAPESVARLAARPNTLLTPHYSGHAAEVFRARATDIARNIDLLDAGRPLERRVR